MKTLVLLIWLLFVVTFAGRLVQNIQRSNPFALLDAIPIAMLLYIASPVILPLKKAVAK